MAHAKMTVQDLLDRLAAREPTPGGGTAAAVTGGVGAALCSMAIEFTLSRKSTDDELRGVLESVRSALLQLRAGLLKLADEDTAAYEGWRAARKAGDPAKEQEALLEAAQVPLKTVKLCRDALEMIAGLVHRLNPHLLTDASSGAMNLAAAARSAALNVRVNLAGVEDREIAEEFESQTAKLLGRVDELESQVYGHCEDSLAGSAVK